MMAGCAELMASENTGAIGVVRGASRQSARAGVVPGGAAVDTLEDEAFRAGGVPDRRHTRVDHKRGWPARRQVAQGPPSASVVGRGGKMSGRVAAAVGHREIVRRCGSGGDDMTGGIGGDGRDVFIAAAAEGLVEEERGIGAPERERAKQRSRENTCSR